MNNTIKNSLLVMKNRGLQSYECRLLESTIHEVSINNDRMDLLRSGEQVSLTLTGILNGSKASTVMSKWG